MNLRIGDMAQLVERRVRNAKARGSNPLISTSEPRYTRGSFFIQPTAKKESVGSIENK